MIDITKEMGYYCKISPDMVVGIAIENYHGEASVKLIVVNSVLFSVPMADAKVAEYTAEQIVRKLEI